MSILSGYPHPGSAAAGWEQRPRVEHTPTQNRRTRDAPMRSLAARCPASFGPATNCRRAFTVGKARIAEILHALCRRERSRWSRPGLRSFATLGVQPGRWRPSRCPAKRPSSLTQSAGHGQRILRRDRSRCRSASSGRQSGTTKPAPTPSILWAPLGPPDKHRRFFRLHGDRPEDFGARRDFKCLRLTPRNEPDVPTLWTQTSTSHPPSGSRSPPPSPGRLGVDLRWQADLSKRRLSPR